MSLSRRAKRGISVFSKIQWSAKRALYHLSQKNMISLAPAKADPLLEKAALEAMDILKRNGEAYKNANVQELPKNEGYTVQADPEGVALPSVPSQPENGQDRTEGPEACGEGGC